MRPVHVVPSVVLTVLLTVACAAPVFGQATLERVSFAQRADGGTVVRLHLDDAPPAYGTPVRDGDALRVMLYNTRPARRWRRDAPPAGIRDYDVAARDGHVELRLDLDADAAVEVDAYRDAGSADVLVRIDAPGARTVAEVAPRRAEAPPPRDVTTLPAQRPAADAAARWRIDTIVIDAGHGGKDSGTIGHGGVKEKDIVLPVAMQVGAYLETLPGVRVVYTRRDDRFIPLRERGRIANEAGGKLFISIHANAAGNARAYGTETFFLGMHKTDAAQSVMERENEVIRLEEDREHYEQFDAGELVRMQLAQSAYMRTSEQLAALVQEQFTERVGRKSRGVKQAGFLVLWSASMPAILVELGFVTNPDEAAFLRSEEGQTYLASAIFRAVRDLKERYERGLNLTTAD